MKINEVLPKDKFDLDSVQKLYKYSDTEILSIGKELLLWLQDMNWPVAQELAPILANYTNQLKDYIIEILIGKDEMWKYWVLHNMLYNSKGKIDSKLIAQIMRIANNPTQAETEHEVDIICKEILDNLGTNP